MISQCANQAHCGHQVAGHLRCVPVRGPGGGAQRAGRPLWRRGQRGRAGAGPGAVRRCAALPPGWRCWGGASCRARLRRRSRGRAGSRPAARARGAALARPASSCHAHRPASCHLRHPVNGGAELVASDQVPKTLRIVITSGAGGARGCRHAPDGRSAHPLRGSGAAGRGDTAQAAAGPKRPPHSRQPLLPPLLAPPTPGPGLVKRKAFLEALEERLEPPLKQVGRQLVSVGGSAVMMLQQGLGRAGGPGGAAGAAAEAGGVAAVPGAGRCRCCCCAGGGSAPPGCGRALLCRLALSRHAYAASRRAGRARWRPCCRSQPPCPPPPPCVHRFAGGRGGRAGGVHPPV